MTEYCTCYISLFIGADNTCINTGYMNSGYNCCSSNFKTFLVISKKFYGFKLFKFY